MKPDYTNMIFEALNGSENTLQDILPVLLRNPPVPDDKKAIGLPIWAVIVKQTLPSTIRLVESYMDLQKKRLRCSAPGHAPRIGLRRLRHRRDRTMKIDNDIAKKIIDLKHSLVGNDFQAIDQRLASIYDKSWDWQEKCKFKTEREASCRRRPSCC